ncbi:MAG TPA: hypothetical protein VN934_11835 [Candidatus Tumulicola sp.]|nr:hypothetical protein [Candidatus Tumulicola sp.]
MIESLTLAFLIAATPPPNTDSWQGVWPEEAFSDVVAASGQPLLTRQLPDGSVLTWNRAPNRDAYMIISTRSGIVQDISAVANRAGGSRAGLTDPSGVSIGNTVGQLKAKRGEPSVPAAAGGSAEYIYKGARGTWIYEFSKGVIVYIRLLDNKPPPAGPATGKDDPHDGSNIQKAYIINARSEDEGVHFERYYANTIPPCAGDWNIGDQALFSSGGKQYDRLDMTCALDKSKRSLLFDITSFFGKF